MTEIIQGLIRKYHTEISLSAHDMFVVADRTVTITGCAYHHRAGIGIDDSAAIEIRIAFADNFTGLYVADT